MITERDTSEIQKIRDEIHKHVREVLTRIERACERAGRKKEDVKVIAVSKTFPADFIKFAWEAGITDFGENYIQEALEKIRSLKESTKLVWHFIGHLQTNKAKFVPGNFDFVHSIDSVKILKELEKRCALKSDELGKHIELNALVQINIGNEPTKSGISPDKVFDFFLEVLDIELKHVRICGLMIIPPPPSKPEDSRPYFRKLKEIRDELLSRGVPSYMLKELSMGMTDDFEVAVEEGATMLRIGRAIFFERGKK